MRIVAIVCLTLWLAVPATSFANQASPDPGPSPTFGIDPANAQPTMPPLDPDDYAKYFAAGTSEVVIHPEFPDASGSSVSCSSHAYDYALLYPRTKFTIWMVENWIYQVQRAKTMHAWTAVPGSYIGDALPYYLNAIETNRPTVVHWAYCDANREFVFRHVPVGQYVVVIQHQNHVRSARLESNAVQVMTADGPELSELPPTVIDTSHGTDGYILYSRAKLVVPAASMRYSLDPNPFKTVAHFQPN